MSICRLTNLLLLILYPAAWLAPLMHAGVLPWFGSNEISIFSGIIALLDVDPALAVLVALLALVIPYGKTLALSAIHFGYLGAQPLWVIEIIGKLSMADVFLVALYIVAVKGVGIGHVETAWGLWLFTACVLTSIGVGWATKGLIAAGETTQTP